MIDRILNLDGTSSTIKAEDAYPLTEYNEQRNAYIMTLNSKNYIWLNNTWMEE